MVGYTGGPAQHHHRSSSNGRSSAGGVGGGGAVGEADIRHRDSSLPRVYEDPDELSSANQVDQSSFLLLVLSSFYVLYFMPHNPYPWAQNNFLDGC